MPLFSRSVSRKSILVWGVISVLLCVAGVHLIYKNENSYVKVM